MSSYTITITPDDTANASATVRVNLGVSGARITELTVRAGDGEGFAPDELPGFELSRLIGAIAPATVARPVLDAGAHAPATTIPAARTAEEPAEQPEPAAAPEEPEQPRATPRARKSLRPAKTARVAKSTRAPAEKAPAKKAAGRKSTAAKSTAGRATGAGKATGKKAAKAAAPQREVRAYRRMPDDVVEVYRQAGGATAMANHYGVPRHTAQGWLRRLRQQGDLPS